MNSVKKLHQIEILREYRKFIKAAYNLNFYNFRIHMIRKIEHDFRNNKDIMTKINLKDKFTQLERIVIVQNLYSTKEEIGQRYCEN